MAVNLRQTHFRFGVEELAESTHGWHAAEDANVSLPVDTTFLLRFTEQETGGTAAGNTDAQFQYNLNGAGWNDITTSSAVVKAVSTGVFANAANCTKRLSGTGTFESSGQGCTHDGLSGGAQNDIAASGNSETECALQIVGADVNNNDTIQLRFTSPDWAVGYDVTPTVTVIKSAPVVVTPGTASLSLTPFVSTVVASDHKTAVPGVASLSLSTFAPTVTGGLGTTVTPGTASLTLSVFAATVTATDHKTVVPGVRALTLTPFAPSASAGLRIVPGPGQVGVIGYAPLVAAGVTTYVWRRTA